MVGDVPGGAWLERQVASVREHGWNWVKRFKIHLDIDIDVNIVKIRRELFVINFFNIFMKDFRNKL